MKFTTILMDADDELKSYRFSVSQLGYAIEQEMEVR